MRPIALIVFNGILLAFTLSNCGQEEPATQTESFTELAKSIKHPNHKFASAPLWVWNADVDSAMITASLEDFKDKGFGGVFIHPRAGLITPYISNKWFDLCSFTLKEAKRLDMDVWIYDENSYPSGFAGGHVPDVMPESFNQGQMLQFDKVNSLPINEKDYFIALKKTSDGFALINDWKSEKEKKGDYYLFKKTFYGQSDWYGGFTYVDLMVKGTTEKFIDQTMGGYEKVFGSEFGKAVPGIFSDEPNIEVQLPHNIRWTPDLFAAFKSRWNYSLETNLPSLFEESGNWRKVRHDYYETLLQLFIDRWSKPYFEYTSKKNLEWTGHYWEHEWPVPNTGPDNMAMYAWHQRPAIDMLFNQFDEKSPHAQFGNVRSVRELASVANQLDKKRTLSETYGGAGWEISFKDLKRLGDWEFALGVNTLNQHLSHMTLMGARKYDYPQSFSYHNPWFAYYKSLNDYFTRLTLMLTAGRQINKILVIEPTTTAWMYYNRDNPNARFDEIANEFQRFVTRLEKSQVEYDLGSENIIRDHGSVTGKTFVIGSRQYAKVILPPGFENADKSTFDLLGKFAAGGGTIIQLSKIKFVDGDPTKAIDDFYSRYAPAIIAADSLTNALINADLQSDLQILQPAPAQGDLYHQRRILSDGEILFLANSSLDQHASGTVNAHGENVLLTDLFTGEIYEYPSQPGKDGLQFGFDIPPAGSMMVFIPAKKMAGYNPYPEIIGSGKEIQMPSSVIKRVKENALSIDFCDIEFGKTRLKDKHVYDATDTLFKFFGFRNGNPWNTSVQFKNNTVARDTFKTGAGFKVSYHFKVLDKTDRSLFRAVVERGKRYKVSINNNTIASVPGIWWLDRAFDVYEIGKYLRAGENTLTLEADKMSVHSEIEPAYVLGDFSLHSESKGWSIGPPIQLKTGSWTGQGMPMYSNEVDYQKSVNLSRVAGKHYRIRLGKWEGTVCSVAVNGSSAGVIAYPPYQLDITSLLKDGNNTIDVSVVGSLKNLLGPFHNSPKPGLVSPWHFRYVKNYPSGKDYDVYDYGLIDDYQLVEN